MSAALAASPCSPSSRASAHDKVVAEAVRLAAAWLEDAGYRVEEVAPPHWKEAAELWALLVLNETRYAMMPSIEAHGDEAIKRAASAMMEVTPTTDFDGFRTGMARRSNSFARMDAVSSKNTRSS